MRIKSQKKYAKIDYSLLIAVLILVGFGLVMIYSTSYYELLADNQSPDALLIGSLRYVVLGIIAMIGASLINYRIYRRFAAVAYLAAISLSFVVLFYGKNVKGGTRWLKVPILNISFMPSEISKLAVIFVFALLIELAGDKIKRLSHFSIMTLLLAVICGLTVLQHDLSTTAIILLLGMTMLFVANCNWLYIATLGVTGTAFAYLYTQINGYSNDRIEAWLLSFPDRVYEFSDKTYQISYSIYAIGNGGIFGKGLGMGEMKLLRLPEVYNDFIFAIICEELGLIGALAVLLIFAFIIYRIFAIAVKSKDRFGYMVAVGAGVLVALQVIINVGVVTNILPTTGITLPFISKGGTSLVILMFLIGIVLNVSLQNNIEE